MSRCTEGGLGHSDVCQSMAQDGSASALRACARTHCPCRRARPGARPWLRGGGRGRPESSPVDPVDVRGRWRGHGVPVTTLWTCGPLAGLRCPRDVSPPPGPSSCTRFSLFSPGERCSKEAWYGFVQLRLVPQWLSEIPRPRPRAACWPLSHPPRRAPEAPGTAGPGFGDCRMAKSDL